MIKDIIAMKDLNGQLTQVSRPKKPSTVIIDNIVIKDLNSQLTPVSRSRKSVTIINTYSITKRYFTLLVIPIVNQVINMIITCFILEIMENLETQN